MENGEEVILQGVAALVQGVIGVRLGPLILTNRRLIWYEPSVARPLKPIYGEMRLSEVVGVDKGTWLDFLGGGKRLRLHLRSGKRKTLAEGEGRLDEWIAALRSAIANSACDFGSEGS